MDIPRFEIECGQTKGCFQYPMVCQGLDCRFEVSYVENQDGTLTFEVMADTDGYVALGFSANTDMVSSE